MTQILKLASEDLKMTVITILKKTQEKFLVKMAEWVFAVLASSHDHFEVTTKLQKTITENRLQSS